MKNEQIIRSTLLVLCVLLCVLPSRAQPAQYSLKEAVNYALLHNLNVKSSELDVRSAEAQIGETRAYGLPQVTANANFIDNIIIQRFFLPGSFSGGAADAPPVAVKFGVHYQGAVSATWNQLIFNGTYLVGLKAAATYRELTQKSVQQTKIGIAEKVTKAYYATQVAEENAGVLDRNIERVDSLLHETKVMNQQGFVELLDVNRLEVQLNNLRVERQKVQNLIELSYALLKYQMGMPLDTPILLTNKISDVNISKLKNEMSHPAVTYNNRIEYSILDTQVKLADLDLRSIKTGYLPVLTGSLGYGHNNGQNDFSNMFTTKWFNNSALTLNLAIPIFDGLSKKYQIQQKKVALEKLAIGKSLLEQTIDLEAKQASITMNNAFAALQTQEQNLALAREVVRVTKIKYKEGVGTNIEVVNAESSLREAQTNFFSALFDLVIARVDLTTAKGELYTEFQE